MKERKTQFKFFTIFGYRKEEQYLSRMHAKGWALYDIIFPGFYRFARCTPEEVKYQIDYNQDGVAHREQYTQMFRDCGWSYLLDFAGFSYFRKPIRDMQGDEGIFCDDESRLDLMRRIFRGRVTVMIVVFFCTLLPQLFLHSVLRPAGGRFSIIVSDLFFALCCLYLVVFAGFGASFYRYERRVCGELSAGGRFRYLALLLMLVVLTGLACGSVYYSHSRGGNDYSLSRWEEGHSIGMNYMNDTVSRLYDLKKGDVIQMEYVVVRGEVRVVVEGLQEGAVFDEELEDFGEIRVEIEEDGGYRIGCIGKRAEGSINFSIQ